MTSMNKTPPQQDAVAAAVDWGRYHSIAFTAVMQPEIVRICCVMGIASRQSWEHEKFSPMNPMSQPRLLICHHCANQMSLKICSTTWTLCKCLIFDVLSLVSHCIHFLNDVVCLVPTPVFCSIYPAVSLWI